MKWPILALCLAASAACGQKQKSDAAPTPNSGDGVTGFSMTVPSADFAKSKFCPAEPPPLPDNPFPPVDFSDELLNEKLSGDGLSGWIHGAVPTYQQYIFTYRKELANGQTSFFEAQQYSLVPADKSVADILAGLHRHDKVRLKGKVFGNASPIKHLYITGVEVITRYDKATDNKYPFDVAALKGKTELDVFGIVHATIDSKTHGRALVVEHKDLLLPIAIPASLNDAVAPAYRGDIVNIAVKVVDHGRGGPPHFEANASSPKPFEIVDPMVNCHGYQTTVTGHLVKFFVSPAISRDVYAVRVVDGNGIGRNYTFVGDVPDPDASFDMTNKLMDEAARHWDASSQEPQDVRNFWGKDQIKVTVTGKMNVVSAEQANAQMYINDLAHLKFGE